MLRKLLFALGAVVLGTCVLFAILAGMVLYYDHAAGQSARRFCASIRPGSEVAAVVARAERERIRHTELEDGAHDFLFPGWGDAGMCRVGVANGKVISLHVQMQGD